MALSEAIRNHVRTRATYICEYCQTAEELTGLKCTTDHIIPKSKGGSDDLDNLSAACNICNGRKYAKTEGIDPQTGETVRLFHPREQEWNKHFQWNHEGTMISGRISCGRATVDALKLNDSLRVAARSIWTQTGHHPP